MTCAACIWKVQPLRYQDPLPHALREAARGANTELAETSESYGVRQFPFIFPMKALEWLKRGIPEDEERYVSLRLKVARRLVEEKAKSEWGAKTELTERSIISATDATPFVYANTQLMW